MHIRSNSASVIPFTVGVKHVKSRNEFRPVTLPIVVSVKQVDRGCDAQLSSALLMTLSLSVSGISNADTYSFRVIVLSLPESSASTEEIVSLADKCSATYV